MEPGEALWIEPCAMIHTFFMKFPIDVLFLDKERRVVRAIENIQPFRLSPWVGKARSVLEFAAGTLKAAGGALPGDGVSFTFPS